MPNKKRFEELQGFFSDKEVEEWFKEQDIEPESSEEFLSEATIEDKYSKTQFQIVRQTMDLSLYNLRQTLADNSYINLSPGYQRRHRWDIRKRSQLIESLLLNIPVPPVFLYENQYNQYEVMDGRQRLETLRDFFQNKFSLTGLEIWPELEKSKFENLPSVIQHGLLRRTLPAIILLAETTKNPLISNNAGTDVRMVLFRRLNTGGIQLNAQELRNALYPGHFNQMIREVSRSKTFTTIWGIPAKVSNEDEFPPSNLINNTLYKTMADCELVLRYFAIKETITEDNKGSLKKILDKCMERHTGDSAERAKLLGDEYLRHLRLLYEIFDGKPFILPKTNKPSRPLYDALMVALSLHSSLNPMPLKAQINSRLQNSLRETKTYDILVGRGNSVESIRERVREAEKILLG